MLFCLCIYWLRDDVTETRRLNAKKCYSDEQIIDFPRKAERGLPVKELFRRHRFTEGSYYLWRSEFGGMTVSGAKCPPELETEDAGLERLSVASVRPMLVREMTTHGLSERRPLRVLGMSTRALRYVQVKRSRSFESFGREVRVDWCHSAKAWRDLLVSKWPTDTLLIWRSD